MKLHKTIKLIPVLLALTGLLPSAASAATYYWDGGTVDIAGNGNGASGGTAGTWNTTIKNWDQGNGLAHVAWPNSTADTASFAGTGAAVTVGTVNAGTVNITTASYTFQTGTITFSSGIIDVNTIGGSSTAGATFTCNLAGSVSFKATGNTAAANASYPPGTINADNTGLTSFVLNANQVGNPLSLLHQGALGPNGSTVTVTKGVLSLSAASGTTYNSWATSFGSGGIRLRVAGTQTYSGNGTLTGNVDFMTIAGATLIYSGTLDLGGNTLTLAPTGSGAVQLNGAISGAGNLAVNVSSVLAASLGDGTVTLGTANPSFTGTATTFQNKGRLTLNHINALQNATLDTGSSGSQSVTFIVAGNNTYNIGALTGSDDLAIGANTLSVGAKAVDTTFSAVISGTGGKLTKVGANKLTLATSPTYDGLTTISAGTLALNNGIALAANSSVSIAAGATFDVSVSSTYTLGSGASLTASGTGTGVGSTAAQIKAGAGATGVDLGSRPVTLNFTPTGFSGDSTHPALYISSGTLNINSALTVVNNGTSPLGNGTYILIKAADASTTGTPTLSGGNVGGQALVTGKNALVQRNGTTGDIELAVQDALPSTTTLTRHTATVDNSTYGDALQFDVSVSGAGVTPTGTVELRDGGQSGTLLGSATLASGAATFSPALNALTAGTHTLYAVYSGDPTYQSGSGTLSQTVLALSVTVSGASASSKMFDNTTAAALTGGTVSAVVSGDTSTEINANGGVFANVGPGTGITVTVALGGTKASSYSLSSPPTFTADILTTATWTATTTPASWNTTVRANWLNNVVGTGSGNTADFNTVNLPADTVVNLTAPCTIGNLIFGDTDTSSAASWTLANNGTGANKLTLAGGTPTVTVNALGAGKIATITAAVDGTAGLTKSGVGTLALGTIGNSYSGGTTINQGILQIANDQHLGAIPGSFSAANIALNGGTLSNSAAVTLSTTRGITLGSSGGTIAFSTGNNSVGGVIAGANPGPLQITGSDGTMNLQGANTYAGGTTLSGSGTMLVGSVNSVGTVGSITSGPFGTGTLNLNGSQLRALISAPSDPVVVLNSVILSADTAFPTAASELGLAFAGLITISGGSRVMTTDVGTTVSGKLLTLSGVIGDGGNNYGVTKAGAGTLVLSGANTYGGPTVVSTGAIVVSNSAALGSTVGATTVASGAGVALAGGVTVAENFSIAGAGPAVGSAIAAASRGALQSSSGNNIISGNVTITAASPRIGCQDGANLTISGTIVTNGLISGLIIRNGLDTSGSTTTISGTGNAWGDTQIYGGTTRLGVNNALPTNGRLQVGVNAVGSTTFDLNGYNQTLVNLQSAGTAPGITNSSATLATLTLNNTGENQSYGGYLNGSIALVKDGAFRQAFTAPTAYTGDTTISAGTLALSGSGSIGGSPVISLASGATLDVTGITPSGYTVTGTSPAQTLAGGSTSGTATVNATGKFVTLASGAALAFRADGGGATAGKISVIGDVNLNANAVTVNVSGAALAPGTYRLLDCTGTLTGSANPVPTITGIALSGGYTVGVVTDIAGKQVNLVVKATPVFSGLTANQSISFGTATVTLGGTVSAGAVYPANGETVSVTINGNAQNATVTGAAGAFLVTFPTAAIPFSATNYPIAYAYAGNATSLNAAANDTSTALTVTGILVPNLAYTNAPGISLKITLAEIQSAGLASSAAVPNYSITVPSATSAQGGTVVTNAAANLILYTPPSGTPSGDSFSYTVTTGSLSATATVTITFASVAGTQIDPALIGTDGADHARFTFYGVPSTPYHVQRATLLAPPNWINADAGVTTGTNGSCLWTDPETITSLGGVVHYRISYP